MPEIYDPTGIEYFTIPSFTFSSGITLDIKIAYRSFNPTSQKTALIPTCYGGRINDSLNFTCGSLSSYHVIVVAMLSNGESTSPSNNPFFPPNYSLRYQDCVNAQYLLVTQHLKLKSLDAVIGFSMGAQQAYYWAAMHGSGSDPFVKNVIVICGSAKTSGHNYAFLEGPISALSTSHDYANGAYRRSGVKPTQGLRAFGRAYAAWLTSPEWFRQGLWREFGAKSLKEWLYPPEAPFETWDAEDLLVGGRMWQAGDIGSVAGDGDYIKALQVITARVLLMPSLTDQYFCYRDSEREVKYLENGIYDPIPTIWGHIGGGGANAIDTKWMDAHISTFLQNS